MAKMSRLNSLQTAEDKKAQRERAIAKRFAQVAPINIDPATIESRKPPAPDIACATTFGERFNIELMELCAPELAKAVGDELRAGGGVRFVWLADPTGRALQKKLCRIYTSEEPIHLLCYSDGLLVTPDDVVLEEMRAVIGIEGLGPFCSIWFHGEDGAHCVASA